MRPQFTKTEKTLCTHLKVQAQLTIIYKDYGKAGWEFHDLICDVKHKKKKPGDCVCDRRKGALLVKPNMK